MIEPVVFSRVLGGGGRCGMATVVPSLCCRELKSLLVVVRVVTGFAGYGSRVSWSVGVDGGLSTEYEVASDVGLNLKYSSLLVKYARGRM